MTYMNYMLNLSTQEKAQIDSQVYANRLYFSKRGKIIAGAIVMNISLLLFEPKNEKLTNFSTCENVSIVCNITNLLSKYENLECQAPSEISDLNLILGLRGGEIYVDVVKLIQAYYLAILKKQQSDFCTNFSPFVYVNLWWELSRPVVENKFPDILENVTKRLLEYALKTGGGFQPLNRNIEPLRGDRLQQLKDNIEPSTSTDLFRSLKTLEQRTAPHINDYILDQTVLINGELVNLTITEGQLIHKLAKHGVDFGVPRNNNKNKVQCDRTHVNLDIFRQRTIDTIKVGQRIDGTYQVNTPAVHFYDKTTDLNVIFNATSGNYIAGWELSERQLNDLIQNQNVGVNFEKTIK